ncbi:MAG: divalent-cation tolerance protein CutA [Candidatus Binatia bacterium]
MTNCIIVLVTVGSPEEGECIARALVDERLAACVNLVGPIKSTYRWQGEITRDEELLLVIKTRAALFAEVEARVKALHSYGTPEVIALPITAGAQAYLEWLRAETQLPGK